MNQSPKASVAAKPALSVTCFAALLFLASAAPARADIVFFSDNPAGFSSRLNQEGITDKNILFEQPGTINGPAPTVTGKLQNGFELSFTSDENLKAIGSGQARIEASDGTFNNLLIDAVNPLATFRSISFQLNPDQRQPDGTLTIVVKDQFGDNPQVFTISTAGLFFFGAIAVNGQVIDTVNLDTGTFELDDIRQVRVGGEQIDTIPEPATVLLFGMGLVGSAMRLRRRR